MNDMKRETRAASSDSAPADGHMLGTFVTGTTIGAAIALLCAPASGATTRRYLTEHTRDGRRRANALFEKSLESMETGRARLSSAIEQGRARWQGVKRQIESAPNGVR